MGKEYQKETAIRGNIPTAPSIIFYDDMEGSFKWAGEGTGTNWIVDKFAGTKEVNNGNYCLRICTRATAPAVGDWVHARRYCSIRTQKVVKFSCFFYPETRPGYLYMQFGLSWYTGSTRIYHLILWRESSSRWEYYSENGTFQPIPGASQTLYQYAHHYLSFTLDLEKKILQQFQCDDLFLNNLSLPVYSPPDTTASCLLAEIYLNNGVAATQKIYIDDIIVEESS